MLCAGPNKLQTVIRLRLLEIHQLTNETEFFYPRFNKIIWKKGFELPTKILEIDLC